MRPVRLRYRHTFKVRRREVRATEQVLDSTVHYHTNEQGLLVKCYHRGRKVLVEPSFWLGVTLSFPIEHYLWTHVWPFYYLSEWMGL